MILVTCTISSFTVEKTSRKIALLEAPKPQETSEETERILLSLAYPETLNDLVDLALILMPQKNKTPLYVLHVVDETDVSGQQHGEGKKMMERAIKHAAATDSTIVPLTRYDVNISNGITYTIKEHRITDLIIGQHHLTEDSKSFFGPVAENILQHTRETIFIYKSVQPLNTLKRVVVTIPPNAEYEQGFLHWYKLLQTMCKETGLPLIIYGSKATIKILQDSNANSSSPLAINYNTFDNWDDFLIFSREVRQDDLFVIVSSRKGYLSYIPEIEKLPKYLVKYFMANSYIILYPEQIDPNDHSTFQPVEAGAELLGKAGNYVKDVLGGTDRTGRKKGRQLRNSKSNKIQANALSS